MQAEARLHYRLDKKYTRFEATIGLDPSAGQRGSAIFKVMDRGDNREIWRQLEADYPMQTDWMLQDLGLDAWKWLESSKSIELEKKMIESALKELTDSPKLKAELAALVASKAEGTDPRWLTLYVNACEARRAAAARLAAKWQTIVFTKHHIMGGSHYAYTEAQSDAQSERTFVPGTALCMLEFNGTSASVKTLIEDKNGVIRDPEVSWDGKRILFAWKKDDRKDDYHLYEMEAASGKVRQITEGLGYADYEPAYLPNGDIIFNSSRCVQTVDCYTTEVSNLYTCDINGKYLRRLCFDQVHTNFPTVLNDGRVVYTRWEYNDRGQVFVQGLMQMNPDGTGQSEFYGMNSWFPTTLLHARVIPDSHKLVAVASGHHTRQTGKFVIIDSSKGQQENTGAQLVAPVRPTEAVHVDAYGQDGDLWQYPYPLNEKQYLVTYTPYGWTKQPTIFGVYFMDIDGRRELLASDAKTSCNQSVPLAARPMPPVRPSVVDYRKKTGTYYMQDVYAGQGFENIPRGTIKKLRVIALDYRLALIGSNGNGGPAGGAMIATPVAIGNGAWDTKMVLGDATVHEDGSAFFEVPARTPVYFQVLDEKGYMVQSMRSWSTLMPGENAACVGCHETKSTAPLSQRKTYAMIRGSEKLAEFYGPARGFSFPKEIQSILDRHCIKCHSNREATRKGTVAAATVGMDIDVSQATKIMGLEEQWLFTAVNPGNGWEKPGFGASKWKSGKGGFGTPGTPAAGKINTLWNTDDVWIRRTFDLPAEAKDRKVVVWCSHDEDIEVYINGVMAVCEQGHITKGRAFALTPEAAKTIKPGQNTIAVHCHQTTGGQYIDVSLLALANTPAPRPPAVLAEGQPKPFSLLGIESVDAGAKRKWSDSYLSFTAASVGGKDAARGYPNPLVHWIHAQSTPPVQPPYSTGAACSSLMKLLEAGHYDEKLSREELEKIACWIDLAVPYCGDYTEANAWSATDWKHHERLAEKRKYQEELERKAIEEYVRERQGSH